MDYILDGADKALFDHVYPESLPRDDMFRPSKREAIPETPLSNKADR